MIINAAVFYSRADKRYVAEGYEIGQIGTGKTSEEAMQDYLKAVRSTTQLRIEEEDVLKAVRSTTQLRIEEENVKLLQSIVSSKCISILEKVALGEVNTQPIIKKVENLEVHFYKGR